MVDWFVHLLNSNGVDEVFFNCKAAASRPSALIGNKRSEIKIGNLRLEIEIGNKDGKVGRRQQRLGIPPRLVFVYLTGQFCELHSAVFTLFFRKQTETPSPVTPEPPEFGGGRSGDRK